MTVVEHSTPSHDTQDAQDLFEEAHRRRRRRRFVSFGVTILVITGAVAYLTSVPGGLTGGAASSPYGSAAPVITRAGLARISFSYRDTEMGGCIPRTNTPVTTGMGSIDLIQHNLAFTTRTQGCGGVFPGQQTESTRWFKGVLYVGESTPLGEQWTAVAAGSLHLQVSHNPLRSLLTSPWMLSILNFVGSSERATGSAVIGGQRVTEYAGTTTVYAVEQQLASVLHSGAIRRELIELGPLVPQARSVTISIDSWRNDKSQVLEIEATEPLYTGIYSGGGDTENAIQVPTETLSAVGLAPGKPLPPIKDIPKDPLQTLRQQSSFEMTVHFSSYGSAPAIVRPN